MLQEGIPLCFASYTKMALKAGVTLHIVVKFPVELSALQRPHQVIPLGNFSLTL